MRQDHIGKAFAWISLAALCFSFMSVFVKDLGSTFSVFQIAFFRGIFSLVVITPILFLRHENFFPKNLKVLLGRGLAGSCGLLCFFYSISQLPLSISSILNWCSPLFVFFLSVLLLKERIGVMILVWTLVTIGGLVFIVHPDALGGVEVAPDYSLSAILVGLLGAFFAGLAYLLIRVATAEASSLLIVWYLSFVVSVVCIPGTWTRFVWPDSTEWLKLLGIGGVTLIAQIAMTKAYSCARAAVVSPMSLLYTAFAALWGWLFFDERLAWIQWGGMIIVGLGISMIVRSESNLRKIKTLQNIDLRT